jgi:hypothetical protein
MRRASKITESWSRGQASGRPFVIEPAVVGYVESAKELPPYLARRLVTENSRVAQGSRALFRNAGQLILIKVVTCPFVLGHAVATGPAPAASGPRAAVRGAW